MNVMWSSRLFRVSLFLENASILMIWGCFSIVSNVIRSKYCCRRHTMHGNMVFSRDSIFPTPQQSGCLCVCSVNTQLFLIFFFKMAAGGHFGSPIWAILDDRKITFDRISRHFRSIHNFFRILPLCVINGYAKYEAFWAFLYKMAAGHFVFPISCNLGPQWLWRIWIWLVYLWQSYGLYKRWRAAAETAAAEPKT